jgi:hypothetical protein
VYIHGLFQQRCRELGITSVYSPPHEHERNGSSEKTSMTSATLLTL